MEQSGDLVINPHLDTRLSIRFRKFRKLQENASINRTYILRLLGCPFSKSKGREGLKPLML